MQLYIPELIQTAHKATAFMSTIYHELYKTVIIKIALCIINTYNLRWINVHGIALVCDW